MNQPAAKQLDADLSAWLKPADPDTPLEYPLKNLKAVIAPCVASLLHLSPAHSDELIAAMSAYYRHAGYSYSGPAAGWAFRCIDPKA